MRRSVTGIWILLLVTGLALVARPAARGARRLHDALVAERVWQEALVAPVEVAAGAPCAWLSCAGIGLDTLVLAGADSDRLHRAPCLDVVAGNTVVVAHRDTHFAPLEDIGVGNRLTLQDRRGVTRAFVVARTLVLPAAEAATLVRGLSADGALILVTCFPFDFLGPAPDRFVVVARPADDLSGAKGSRKL